MQLFRRFIFTIDKPLRPPFGYASWLDYAVEHFSSRDLWLDSVFANLVDPLVVELDREQIRESARIELRELRKTAAGS